MKYLLFAILINPILTFGAITNFELETLFDATGMVYQEEMDSRNEVLLFNPLIPGIQNTNWSFPIVHASYVFNRDINSNQGQHMLNIFGGLGRLKDITLDGIAVILCHEIGHGLAGSPYKESGMSVEAQSDYYATSDCLKRIFSVLEPSHVINPTKEIVNFCNDQSELYNCVRILQAIEGGIIVLFKHHFGGEYSVLENATNIALEINYEDTYYPSPKCRIQTLVHGALGLKRPTCWYPSKLTNK